MKNYKAVITEATAKEKGMVIANTKMPGRYNGMSKKEFTEATKYISCFTIEIQEL